MESNRIRSYSLSDFGQFFPEVNEREWAFSLTDGCVVAQHHYSRIKLTFVGDGIVHVEFNEFRGSFDIHAEYAQGMSSDDALLCWVRKIPGMELARWD